MAKTFWSEHPVADHESLADGVRLFVERHGRLVNASKEGQVAMRELLEAHLERIDRNPKGVPIRLYFFMRYHGDIDEPRPVTIDPGVGRGLPTIA